MATALTNPKQRNSRLFNLLPDVIFCSPSSSRILWTEEPTKQDGHQSYTNSLVWIDIFSDCKSYPFPHRVLKTCSRGSYSKFVFCLCLFTFVRRQKRIPPIRTTFYTTRQLRHILMKTGMSASVEWMKPLKITIFTEMLLLAAALNALKNLLRNL